MKRLLIGMMFSIFLMSSAFASQAPATQDQQQNVARNTFPVVILVGRPGAGKSEVMDFLKNTPTQQREQDFHVGEFTHIDDFPFLWSWFEEDSILAKYGKKRLYTDSKEYFNSEFLWDLLIERINLAVQKQQFEDKATSKQETIIIEFSRGNRSNGYHEAFSYLSDDILKNAAIVYVSVSYKESCRRNQARAIKGQEDSELHHSLPAEKMEYYYKSDDWKKLTKGKTSGFITVKGHKVPYSVLSNEPTVTDCRETFTPALKATIDKLWALKQEG
jgi:adenylate kinase family enzyme